jgi:hypothetical protein
MPAAIRRDVSSYPAETEVPSFQRRAAYTHKPVYSRTPIVLGVPRPHVHKIDKLTKLVRELPTKRRRTEVSASFNLAALVPSAGTLRTLKI